MFDDDHWCCTPYPVDSDGLSLFREDNLFFLPFPQSHNWGGRLGSLSLKTKPVPARSRIPDSLGGGGVLDSRMFPSL